MDAANTAHVESIVAAVSADVRAKYAKGQREHGGDLWTKPGMIDHAIEEVLDLAVYLYTLRADLRRLANYPVEPPAEQRYDDSGLYQNGRLWCDPCRIQVTTTWTPNEQPPCPRCGDPMERREGDDRFGPE